MLQSIRLRRGQKALVIVAHPDDETIWMGGFILRYAQLDWTIHALCRASDPDRAPKFMQVCRFYGARGSMSDLPDDDATDPEETAPAVRAIVRKLVRGQHYDLLFTHGANGEYGHDQHRTVHRVIRDLARAGELPARRSYAFHYGKRAYRPGRSLVPLAFGDLSLPLKPSEYRAKLAVMTDIYGFTPGGIDAGYSPQIESFKLIAGPRSTRP